ncbi:hypothetical protein F5Y16DRAFT_392809 [Xylariaceae sp. FL0255]|nr:hypothetical protein F5Y16DRAFT_392809 [Xylariaceae sp. FL0255]
MEEYFHRYCSIAICGGLMHKDQLERQLSRFLMSLSTSKKRKQLHTTDDVEKPLTEIEKFIVLYVLALGKLEAQQSGLPPSQCLPRAGLAYFNLGKHLFYKSRSGDELYFIYAKALMGLCLSRFEKTPESLLFCQSASEGSRKLFNRIFGLIYAACTCIETHIFNIYVASSAGPDHTGVGAWDRIYEG